MTDSSHLFGEGEGAGVEFPEQYPLCCGTVAAVFVVVRVVFGRLWVSVIFIRGALRLLPAVGEGQGVGSIRGEGCTANGSVADG